MPDDHSNVDDDADLYGEDAYDDDAARDRTYADEDDVVGRDEYVEDAYGDDPYDEDETGYRGDRSAAGDDDSWWDEGLIGLLLVTGTILFFFPEPFTTTVGIALLALGVLAWVADALT